MTWRIVAPITGVQTIAVGRSIRELPRLVKHYGTGRWRKLKGFTTVEFDTGTRRRAEIHWYEAHGLGKRELKIKRAWSQST